MRKKKIVPGDIVFLVRGQTIVQDEVVKFEPGYQPDAGQGATCSPIPDMFVTRNYGRVGYWDVSRTLREACSELAQSLKNEWDRELAKKLGFDCEDYD